MPLESPRQRRLACWWLGVSVLLVAVSGTWPSPVRAQQEKPDVGGPSAEPLPPADLPPATEGPAPPAGTPPQRKPEFDINFFTLMIMGGWFMVPIGLMSILGVTFAIERGLALRRNRLMPEPLVSQLGQLGSGQGGFDPRQAYRICQQFPCAASAVIRAMLVKIGRPHSELEHAVSEASEREAERAYGNVRWLSLCTAVTPLMGLLGTVWGMIVAFHETTQMIPGQDRAQQLAEGIYIALVTTLAGLIVAIPSAIIAHFFETRIITVFHEIDELLFNLLPLVERYEGRVRFGQKLTDDRPATEEPPPGAKT